MRRILMVFGLVAIVATAPRAATAQGRYGGQVFMIGTGTSAEIKKARGYVPLAVGDRVSEGDCIRLFPVGRPITIRRADGTDLRLVHDSSRECTPVPRTAASGNLLTRYIEDLFGAFKRRLPASLRGAAARDAIKVAGLGDPRPRAAVASGRRSLYVNWCNPAYMKVTLSGPGEASFSTPALTEQATGAQLPTVDLVPGPWRLTFTNEETNRSRYFGIDVLPAAELPLPASAETPLQRLEQAAVVSSRDRSGRFDFEALQLLSKGESDAFRDVQAREFCVTDWQDPGDHRGIPAGGSGDRTGRR
jgi:hypothetical protein